MKMCSFSGCNRLAATYLNSEPVCDEHADRGAWETPKLYDVIEVSFDDPDDVRVIAEGKTLENAEAIVGMAVMRRGVETSYFTTRPAEEVPDA